MNCFFLRFSYCNKLYEVGHTVSLTRTMLPHGFQSHIICAGLPGEGDGACNGDSGGPLAQFVNSSHPHYQQLGKGH